MLRKRNLSNGKQYFKDCAGTGSASFHGVSYADSWEMKKEGKDEPVSIHHLKSKAIEMANWLDGDGQIESQGYYQEK